MDSFQISYVGAIGAGFLSFASRLVQQGLPLYEVMHMTGHKSLVMVQRYAHLAPEFQERAIVALNRYGHDLGTLGLDGPDGETQKQQNPKVSLGVMMVEPDGIEPTTSTMPL
ncbi:MAG: tyrosine-type recombinase/integrase [Rhodospirillales bacterium]|nr:tyrosine-type recombinase/integrase [Rhodospirillales bacterium]